MHRARPTRQKEQVLQAASADYAATAETITRCTRLGFGIGIISSLRP
jgi:hypothetical protein